MRVSETMVFVRDLDEAIRFYTHQVGFELLERHEWGFAYLLMPGGHRLGLMLDSAWTREYPDDENLPHPRVALQTDDLEGEIKRLHEAGVHVGPVRGEQGEQRATVFWDSDGNSFFLWADPKLPLS